MNEMTEQELESLKLFVSNRGYNWDRLTDIQKNYYKEIRNMKAPNKQITTDFMKSIQDVETVDNYHIQKIYDNRTVYIVGGGPSLKGFDFASLTDKCVIAVNKAMFDVPDAGILYFSDRQFFTWYQSDIVKFNGLIVTKSNVIMPYVINLHDTGQDGLELDPSGVRNGGNSGYSAINLAVHTGAKRIILLGFDMKSDSTGNFNYHNGYDNPQHPDVYKKTMLPHFESLVKPLKELGIQVINGSKHSEIKCWFRCTAEDALLLDNDTI